MWLIYGSKGWIGGQFIEILNRLNIPYTVGEQRLESPDLQKEIENSKANRVISFTGRTHGPSNSTIDYLEENRDRLVENIRDNLYGPYHLAQICRDLDIHYTYLGTGCIFEFDSLHPFTEDAVNVQGFTENDRPNFFGSSYSIVKGFTDQILSPFPNVLNVRIRMPISHDLTCTRNFIYKLLHYKKICSLPNSMTVLPDLLPILVDMIQKKRIGTINLTNPGVITHNQILDLYKEILDPTFVYENFTYEEQLQLLPAGRSNNFLETKLLETDYFVLPIFQSVQRLFKQIRQARLHQQGPLVITTQTILVTGGFGFIGSNFIHFLLRQYPKCHVINIDRLDYCARKENLREFDSHPHLVSYVFDLNLTDRVREILEKHHVDIIVHFAAQSHVDNSFQNSLSFTHDNVSATHSLIEASRAYGHIQRFFHMSTDEVYGETTQFLPFSETDIPHPTNPYAASKLAAESIALSYFNCFGMPVVLGRGNNVFGPRQYPEKLISKFILSLLHSSTCTIHGNGRSKRSFLYVEDMVKAVHHILLFGELGEIYNIGAVEEYDVLTVAETLVQFIHPNKNWKDFITYVPDRYYNDYRYWISSQKLYNLGWKPLFSFHEGLQNTIHYIQNNLDLYKNIILSSHTVSSSLL